MIRLSDGARGALRDDEVLLVDWHRTGLCCSDAGEMSVRVLPARRLPRGARHADVSSDDPVFAHPLALHQVHGLDVTIDCRFLGRWRRFRTDLPPDAGLRACLGRLPAGAGAARPSPHPRP